MSRILFGQSYYLRFDPKLWDAMQPYPPLGTLYAAAYMRARGHEDGWDEASDRTRTVRGGIPC